MFINYANEESTLFQYNQWIRCKYELVRLKLFVNKLIYLQSLKWNRMSPDLLKLLISIILEAVQRLCLTIFISSLINKIRIINKVRIFHSLHCPATSCSSCCCNVTFTFSVRLSSASIPVFILTHGTRKGVVCLQVEDISGFRIEARANTSRSCNLWIGL